MFYGFILLIGIHSALTDSSANERLAPCRMPVQIIERHMNTLGKLVNVTKTQCAILAQYETGKAKLEVYETGIVHLTVGRRNNERKSFAVIETPQKLAQYKLDVNKNRISVNLFDGIISYMPETMKLTYESSSGLDVLDLSNVQFGDSGIVAALDIHSAKHFYGLGEKTLPFNKYGSRCIMWNSDFPAYSVKHDTLYESIPFLLKANPNGSYGLLFDNPSRATFDVGASDSNKLVYTAASGAFELYIITGKNAAEVVQRLSELTGKMHMPPIWALGYQQSRWSYYPEEKVLDLARCFRENEIPCDVIYLDIDYMDGYRCFTWSSKNFPTPRKMIDTLHNLGFKVVTIIDPGIKNEKGYHVYDSGIKEDVFVKKPVEDPVRGNGNYFVGKVWPGDCVFPDFLNEKTREWWGNQYKFLLDYGVDGFWNDMNEPSVFNSPNKTFPSNVVHSLDDGTATHACVPERLPAYSTSACRHAEVHNVYGMQMARATREGLEKLEPDRRPFVLTRANYAGGQRYAAMWTGDNFASFAHMKLALAMFLNLGVSGQPFVGSDVGGFIGNPDAELFSRWLELGVFTPFFRTHSVIDSKPREPWAFDSASTRINREIVNRRYELLPEIYTAFRNANQHGLPIVKPLYLNFPDDEEVYNISDEFLLGDNLLVAPVFDSGAVSRKLYLPTAKWASVYDGSEIESGWREVNSPVGKTPVFVKDGTILFTQSIIQWTGEQADTLILRVYGEESAKGYAYFDDGGSFAYKDGSYLDMNVSYETSGSRHVLRFEKRGKYKPGYKYIAVQVMGRRSTSFHMATMRTTDGHELIGTPSNVENGLVRFTFPFRLEAESITIE